MGVNASGFCLSKDGTIPRDALCLCWVLAAWHWDIKSPQSLTLTRPIVFYSEGLCPFSDWITEVLQILLEY